MLDRESRMHEAELKRLSRVKSSSPARAKLLGPEMVDFFKHTVQKRQTKLTKIAECWGQLVPPELSDHCSLESLTRGTLSVLVDSSAHLYQLKQLLLSSLEKQLIQVCKSTGLRKITLRPGRWYEEQEGQKKLHFE
jgi:hypothetical protein